jgi:hypothetical protein
MTAVRSRRISTVVLFTLGGFAVSCGQSDPAAVDTSADMDRAPVPETRVVGVPDESSRGSLPDSTTDAQDEMAMRVLRADPELSAKLSDGTATVSSISGFSDHLGRPFGVVARLSFSTPTELTGTYFTTPGLGEDADPSEGIGEDGKMKRVPLPESLAQNVGTMMVGIEEETESIYLVWVH